jgi:hypothetical protein
LRRPLRLGFAEPPPLGGEALGNALQGFPYEGKLSPEATDEVDCVA